MEGKPEEQNAQIIMRKIGNHVVYMKVTKDESSSELNKMILVKTS